jgi:DNA-binding CsgD family transcriptional regulator/RimJ/RimL family protein N-acetyltransferase
MRFFQTGWETARMATSSPDAEQVLTPPILSDGVVLLRPPTAADAPDIAEACQDQDIVRWTTIPTPYTLEDAHTWISAHGAGDQWWGAPTWAVTHGGARWGGTVDLRLDGVGGAEVGYLVAPWLRGNQVATRALRLACGWAFMALRLEVIRWCAGVGNDPSRTVATKVGFRIHRDVLRLGLVQRGERIDGWIGDLLPADLVEVTARRSPFTGPSLTPREREVLDQLAAGQSNRSISQSLGISENTVKNHVRKILEKLQATSRVDAVIRGVHEGLTTLG